MRVHWITDVNKPGSYPLGGWFFVVKGLYTIVSGRYHETREEALREIGELELSRKDD